MIKSKHSDGDRGLEQSTDAHRGRADGERVADIRASVAAVPVVPKSADQILDKINRKT